jgi:hypothetical protein
MTVFINNASHLHPLSLVGYLQHVGNIVTTFVNIYILHFKEVNNDSITSILIVAIIHSGLYMVTYFHNCKVHGTTALNAHFPKIFHYFLFLYLFITTMCSITDLKYDDGITTYFRFLFGYNLVHLCGSIYWFFSNPISLRDAFSFTNVLPM